ncbi:hypothetical protein GY15_04125 [Delftia sp. 670]|nr:hypothetical protein GY15_04125 [Delftia sp. 670]
MVGHGQQFILAHVAGLAFGFQLGRQARAVVIDHLHAEAMRPAFGDALADAAHADDAQRAAVHFRAGKQVVAPGVPLSCAQVVLAFGHAAGRGHQQGKAEIGRGLGQHVGGIRALHTCSRHRRHVEVVVAHGHVGHHLQARAGGQQRRIDGLRARGQHSILVLQMPGQFLRAPDHVILVGLDLEVLLQLAHHFGRDGTGDQDAGFACHVCLFPCLGVRRFFSGTR